MRYIYDPHKVIMTITKFGLNKLLLFCLNFYFEISKQQNVSTFSRLFLSLDKQIQNFIFKLMLY